HWWQIPLDLTLRGGIVSGTFSPVFLMLPLSLIGWRKSQVRRLLFAAIIFGEPALLNTGARFLIPAAPFAAMALGIAMESVGLAAGGRPMLRATWWSAMKARGATWCRTFCGRRMDRRRGCGNTSDLCR